ncbi:hypothetical protein D3C77_782180 [compost metagenome]
MRRGPVPAPARQGLEPVPRPAETRRQLGADIPLGGVDLSLRQENAVRKIGSPKIRIPQICTDEVSHSHVRLP